MPSIAIIGMGEAGSALVSGWGAGQAGIRAYDIKTETAETAGEMWARYDDLGVTGCGSAAEAIAGADIVFSTVTADQAVVSARVGAAHLARTSWWFDLNSCAPASKEISARAIAAVGGQYVDVAVMAPVYPKRNLVPCLISGPAAETAAKVMAALPMDVRVVGEAVGRASSIKMIRSVLVKGLEALTAECILAATAAGVEDEVFPSLHHGHPKLDLRRRGAYNFERMLAHGARRAAEMEEVARTLEDLGLPNRMSAASVDWQRDIASARTEDPPTPEAPLSDFTDLLLAALRRQD